MPPEILFISSVINIAMLVGLIYYKDDFEFWSWAKHLPACPNCGKTTWKSLDKRSASCSRCGYTVRRPR